MKKRIMRAGALLLAALLTVGMAAEPAAPCVAASKGIQLKIGKKKVGKKTYSLKKGKKAVIKVTGVKTGGNVRATFKSQNTKTATVSAKGVVKAKKKGTAKITVKVKDGSKLLASSWVNIRVKGKTVDAEEPDDAEDGYKEPESTINIKEINVPDGESQVYAKVYEPKETGVYPAIIMSHGYNGANSDFTSECTYFAKNGYVACALDFCGGSARSKSSGKTTDTTIFTEKSNLVAVFKYIQNLENVDRTKVYLHGGSQGGLVAAMAAEEVADEVKGLLLYFPAFNIPDNWRDNFKDVTKIPETYNFWGLTLGRNFFVAMRDYYPLEEIGKKYKKNVLIQYGMKDNIVPYSYMTKAKDTYEHCKLITYANDGHGFTPGTGVKAREAILQFMQNEEEFMQQP